MIVFDNWICWGHYWYKTQAQQYLGHSDKVCPEEEQLSFPTKMEVEDNIPLWHVYCWGVGVKWTAALLTGRENILLPV